LRSQFQSFQSFQSFNPLRSVQAFEKGNGQDSTSIETRDRRRYLHWLFEAKKRFGLCVLDYIVTSNHIHLHRCLVYIDLNMVRAGVVGHPGQWKESGFSEIRDPPKRYRIVDLRSLSELSGFVNLEDFQRAHREWNEQRLENGLATRHDQWSEAIAVGSLGFVEQVKRQLGIKPCIAI
jgi:hypothetical protein